MSSLVEDNFLLSLVLSANQDDEDDEVEDEPLPDVTLVPSEVHVDDIDIDPLPIIKAEKGTEGINVDSAYISDRSVLPTPILLDLVNNAVLDEEDEEEDEPLPFLEPKSTVVDLGSSDFIEAKKAVESDPWNVNAWIAMVEEAEMGRSGQNSLTDVYQRFLSQFPRAGRYWRLLADIFIKKEDYSSAEEVFRKSLLKCRSVGLWKSYLTLIRKKSVDRYSKNSEHYQKEREILRMAYERAIDNVGMSLESNIIWRDYLDFIKEWPENNELEQGQKLKALRDVYQKAICVPMDDLDNYWKEYETLEKQAGEHLAAQLLPEFHEKHLQAKVVQRERKRMSAKIQLDRIAVPPTKSVSELQQLELWSKWLK